MRYRKIISALCCLSFIAVLPTAAYAKDEVTAKNVYEDCRKNGVATVEKLYENDEKGFQIVLDGIASGNAEWILASSCVAHSVYLSGNASAPLGLDIAWAEALPKNPREVLKLEGDGLSLSRACSIPFIEPEKGFFEAYYKDAVEALDKVTEDYYQLDKAACKLRLKAVYDLPWSEPN